MHISCTIYGLYGLYRVYRVLSISGGGGREKKGLRPNQPHPYKDDSQSMANYASG